MNLEGVPARSCGSLNWKCRPEGGNGPVNDSSCGCRKKPPGWARFPRSEATAGARRTHLMRLRTAVGVVEFQVFHGVSGRRHWGCPEREHWELFLPSIAESGLARQAGLHRHRDRFG
jgi:hypothetical protein